MGKAVISFATLDSERIAIESYGNGRMTGGARQFSNSTDTSLPLRT